VGPADLTRFFFFFVKWEISLQTKNMQPKLAIL